MDRFETVFKDTIKNYEHRIESLEKSLDDLSNIYEKEKGAHRNTEKELTYTQNINRFLKNTIETLHKRIEELEYTESDRPPNELVVSKQRIRELEKSLGEVVDLKNREREDYRDKISALEHLVATLKETKEVPVPSSGKQERYSKGDYDYIDDTFESMPFERFVGAFQWTIGKYFVRFGRKDDLVAEATKIADYANRFLEKVKLHVETQNEIPEEKIKK